MASAGAGDGGAESARREPRADMADPESPASPTQQLLPSDYWHKVKVVPNSGSLSPGVYYPTASKRCEPVPSPTL